MKNDLCCSFVIVFFKQLLNILIYFLHRKNQMTAIMYSKSTHFCYQLITYAKKISKNVDLDSRWPFRVQIRNLAICYVIVVI